ncbi:TlpA family protein disulfide reductase [Polynucleobacter sp. Latsch14-2]|uniref:TlpA family protein disulfide reductase n=1 Tax=Polynucleobacter sp. Latsch14-2 TaxID=2576920 RepID=UPI001C0BAE57|nr:TlpA family protein disulfide reductase [Polynucleobacter sp. Latsch14-2]
MIHAIRRSTARDFLLSLFFISASLGLNCAYAQWQPSSKVDLSEVPPLVLNNLAGTPVNINAFKGKVVLVNFWASWCEPCREEFVELIYLQEKYGPKGLKVLAVNLAEMKPRITQFLKGNGIAENALEIVQDRNSIIYKTWKARGIPTTFLLGKQGKIEGVWIGAIDNADTEEVTGKIELLLRK